MARVIDTPSGALLTSPMNAHSFGRGDEMVIGTEGVGYVVLEVRDNRIRADRSGCWIELLWLTADDMGGPVGAVFGMEFELNEPLDRVVGARSTAGGSHL